jgi:hypothetical protein
MRRATSGVSGDAAAAVVVDLEGSELRVGVEGRSIPGF